MFFFFLNSDSILSVFHYCIANHLNLGWKQQLLYYIHGFCVAGIQRRQAFLLQNVWILIWECSKCWDCLSGWVLGAGFFIDMSGGWAEWFEGLDYYQSCLHMASSCGLGYDSCIWEEHLETECSMRLRQKLRGFFLTSLRNHAVTPP